MTDVVKIFIGYDPAEAVAYNVLQHSILRNSSLPVQIAPLAKHHLGSIHKRPRDPLQSNDFSFTRFLVPYLCDYKGWAIFMDCDMLLVDDIAKLWALRDPQYSVRCVKHKHVPREKKKYLGTIQTQYERKNWSSVMLMNCQANQQLSPEYVDVASGLDLHQFKWVPDDRCIGDLPLRWNYLVDYYLDLDISRISNLHFTEGGPYFAEYADCPFAFEWWEAYREMLHCEQPNQKLNEAV
jgi:hypothetical protein